MIPIQYQNSPVIKQLADYIYQYFDGDALVNDFYNKVLNIETAQGFGLDWWGQIVGVGRYFTIPAAEKKFGFNTPNKSYLPFNRGTFRNGDHLTETYKLSDNAYRRLIMTKAMVNIARPTAEQVNIMLKFLFNGRRCYVLDLGGMAVRYVFAFFLQPFEKAIIESDFFPRPAGVRVEIVEIPRPDVFGFEEEVDMGTFNFSTFYQMNRLNDWEKR